jgi:hypothetical protein
MEMSMRVMNQVEVSTTLTLVRFLSSNLGQFLNALDTCILSVVILLVTFVVGREYLLGALSRRLAVLLILEKLRPLIAVHIANGELFKVHGLFVNAGFLSIVALIPPSIKTSKEVSILMQAFLYLYSNVFDFLSRENGLQLTIFGFGLLSKVWLAQCQAERNTVFRTLIEIAGIASTYLCFSIIQQTLEVDPVSQVFHLLLYFILFQYLHNPELDTIQDFLVYNFAIILIGFITSDEWYWAGILFVLYQLMSFWLTIRNGFVQILLIMLSNLVVGTILQYIRQLAVHDTVITLKTSALIVQFLIHEFTIRVTEAQTK